MQNNFSIVIPVLNESENIEKYAQGIRILNNPILNDVDDAITNALSFINEILNISDTGSNSGIKVEKNVEDETSDTEEEINLDELINKFVEKQGTDALNDYLETYLQKGQIVVTEISAFGLIKLISKDDNLDNFISISGTVEKGENMWDELATLIGETESEWAKDEFKDENSNSIVLLYCEGKYVYAFSNPEDQEEEDKVETSEDDTSLDDILKDLGYDSENLDLTMFDIDDQAIIKKSSDKIQKDKALTGLIYVNQKLEELGFEVDGHNPFFFTSVVHVSDKDLSGFLYVNMDGFYSNCVYEKEIQMIFSWDSITDIKIIEEDEDSIKFNLYSNEGSLTIYEPYSKNTKILLSIYKYIWQVVVERFKSEGVIQWSVVEGEMGVNIYSFESHEEYLEWINN